MSRDISVSILLLLALAVGEIHNLAATLPEKAEELQKLLDNWRRHVDAKMPVPNPDWSPENP